MAVTALRKLSSGNQNRQSKQDSEPVMPTSFARVLDEATKKEQQPLPIRTSGYTKDASLYYNFISKREYVQ